MANSRPMTLAEQIQDSVLRHPRKSVAQIAEEMWGTDEDGNPKDKKLYREINPMDHGAKLGILDLIPLLRATGELGPLYYINQALGLVAFPMPAGSADRSGLLAKVAEATREFGEMMTELSVSLADGKLTEDERKRCIKETYEAYQALAALYALLEQEA